MPSRTITAEPHGGIENIERLGAGHHVDSLVIIPTYNEADNLKVIAPQILNRGPFHVLIVDDNSPDGTGDLADSLARCSNGRLSVLHRPGKMGLASAYLQGFAYALERDYSRIFQMDADLSHDPKALPLLRCALDRADVALGSRYVPGGGTKDWPAHRQLLSRGGAQYARMVLGLPYRDLTSGFKAFKRHVLESFDLKTIKSEGYAFQIEMTHRCHQMGFKIMEMPITFQDRRMGRSKIDRRIILEALIVVWRLRRSRLGETVSEEIKA